MHSILPFGKLVKPKVMNYPKKIDIALEKVKEITSTNDYLAHLCKESKAKEFYTVIAESQTKGKGQRGNSWESEAGKNLTFSIFVRHHPDLKAQDQFALSDLTAQSVVEFLSRYDITSRVKLPNDIYIGMDKICGILIENTLRGNSLYSSIIGIGLNVNQTEFDPSLPNPTSMSICKKHKAFDIDECLESLIDIFKSKYYAFISAMTA